MATAREVGKTIATRAPELGGGVMRQIVEFAIYGWGRLPGAKVAAAKQLEKKGDREAAIDSLIAQHVSMAGAQGLVTNLGGLLTLPVAVPANIAAAAVVQVRLVASIAHLRGYDIEDARVRSALTMCLLGAEEVEKRVRANVLPGRPFVVATAPVFDSGLDRVISEHVFGDLAAKVGSKHLTVLVAKRVPLVGGPVGAAVDGWNTWVIGNYAKDEFLSRHRA